MGYIVMWDFLRRIKNRRKQTVQPVKAGISQTYAYKTTKTIVSALF